MVPRGKVGIVVAQIETGIGIVKEHLLLIGHEKTMRTIIKDFTLAASISFILVLPLSMLELLNNSVTKGNASDVIRLFAVLWLLPTAFIVMMRSTMRSARAGNTLTAKPLTLLLKGRIFGTHRHSLGMGSYRSTSLFSRRSELRLKDMRLLNTTARADDESVELITLALAD